ncbi:hypothetical protein [Piscinibacter sp.]|uniref:hypothetical protein n=1 Tax=Piscinibacter sp. TaxID=1903157 RepID=UPI002C9F756D|nr:hypothetical protein [Albitalea sp.]HUG26610.1 hypothetical protein [Albitalea sp.]
MLCLLGAAALAWGYYAYSRILPTPALVAAWGLFAALIATALLRRARIRRRAFLAVYVAVASPLQRWLRGGVLLALRPLLLAAVLALLLMVALARLDDHRVWLALIAAGPVLVLVRAWLLGRLANHAGPLYLPILSWRLAALLVGGGLTVLLVWLAFHQAYPEFAGVSLERAVWHLVDQELARSGPAQVLLQTAAAKDGLRLWLAQQLMPAPAISLVHLLGWLLVLAEEVLFVWSYLLLCHGLLIGAGTVDRTGR